MTITVSSTDRRDGKALALFARCAEWQQGHTKDGRSFFAIPGSESNLLHMADARECSCPDFQRSRNLCKHVRAVKLWMAAFKTGAVVPKREPRLTTTAQDDLIVLMPEGAAHLAELAADEDRASRQVPGAKHTVTATSWSPCNKGCGALVAPEDGRICAECRAQGSATYRALFGVDDDKPYCGPCGRHHDTGAHYAIRAS